MPDCRATRPRHLERSHDDIADFRLAVSRRLLTALVAGPARPSLPPAAPRSPSSASRPSSSRRRPRCRASSSSPRSTASRTSRSSRGFDRFVVGEKQNLELDKPYGVGDARRQDLRLRHQRHRHRLRPREEAPSPRWPARSVPGRLAQPVNISIERRRHQVRRRPGARPGRRLRPRRRLPAGLRRARDLEAGRRRRRSATASTSPTTPTAWSRSSTRSSGELLKTIGDKGDPAERLDRPTNLAFDREGRPLRHRRRPLPGRQVRPRRALPADLRQARRQPGSLRPAEGHGDRPRRPSLRRRRRVQQRADLQPRGPAPDVLRRRAARVRAACCCRRRSRSTTTTSTTSAPYAAPEFEIEYLVLVTSQFGDRMVSVYGFGHERGKHYPTEEELQETDRREAPQGAREARARQAAGRDAAIRKIGDPLTLVLPGRPA